MENKCKRFLSLLLALVMVIGVMPMGQARAEGEGVEALYQVTEVAAGEQYVFYYWNVSENRAVYNGTNGGKMNAGSGVTLSSDGFKSYLWTLEAVDSDTNGEIEGYRIKGVVDTRYIKLSQGKAELVDVNNAQVFTFTNNTDGFHIKANDVEYGYFNNYGGGKAFIAGHNTPTPIRIYKYEENHIHNEVEIPATEASWDGPGMSVGKRCTVCGATTEAPVVVTPALYNQGIVPLDKIIATAGNYQEGNGSDGPANNAKDENFSTQWHTSYANNQSTSDAKDRWIDYQVIGDFKVTGLRYKGRNKDINGNITQYKIQVSYNGTDYEDLTTGTWTDDGQWKEVKFTKPVAPTNVRLFAVTSNGGFAAAVEMRLVGEELSYAKDLNDSTIVSLKECLYTLTGTANGNYSLVHGGHYYVKPSADGNDIVHTTAGFTQIYLETEWNNKENANAVRIRGTEGRVSGGGYIHFRGHENKPYWDRCTSAHEHIDGDYNKTDNFYFFSKNKDGSGNEIPGFTMVEPGKVTVGQSYLIAAKKTDNNVDTWYILCPTDSNNEYEHIAKVVSRADNETVHVHDENNVTTTATCVAAGVKTITCTCGHVHKVTDEATGIHTWTDATCTTPKTCSTCGATEGDPLTPKNAQPLMDNWQKNNMGVVSLSACEYVLSGTQNGSYSLCNSGTYYVNPAAADGTGIPQQNAVFEGLSLTFSDGKVQIASGNKTLRVNNVANAVNLKPANADDKYHPWWHNFVADPPSHTTDFYLLKANPESTNTNIPGYEIVTDVAAGESYLIAFKNDVNEWFVMYPSTETVALAMVVASKGEFEITYTNISMANDLKVNFAFKRDAVANWSGYYAEIVKDGREDPVRIPFADWKLATINSKPHYYVTFDGVAAKEMTDQFHVTIYNAEGQAVSKTYTDTVAAYAHRSMANNPDANNVNANNVNMIADMLNYGAAAQNYFDYNTENLANANLDEDLKSRVGSVTLERNEAVCKPEQSENFSYLANVDLECNIRFMMSFTGITRTMEALITYESWNGVSKRIVIPAKNFEQGDNGYYFTIEDTVIADADQPITCTIYNGHEPVFTVTDSIKAYASRAADDNANSDEKVAMYKAIVKFSESAKTYLNNKKSN